ncbi:MAG: serine/threonine dehydratase [Kangiellaceae bacterium]|jgi:threonine dehydratase|nr:serine/threonine dehydratase [Kangiellaceae bacterium]
MNFQQIENAHNRINRFIHRTPIVQSHLLNQWLGHTIYFKAECLQKIGAFKARGGLNAVAHLVEQGKTPNRIVANSSGNHAQAVAWAAQQFDIPATIYMPSNVSKIKAQATASYGAEVVILDSRAEVDAAVEQASLQEGVLWIPPYNHEDVIAGQGTAVREALEDLSDVDAIFAPCGGGGLVSGSFIAARHMSPNSKVIGVEPLNANDAAESRRAGKIVPLSSPPNTIADGVRTPSVGDLTFPFIQQLDEFYEIEEEKIFYWTQWLTHLLKLNIEPTCAMPMEAVVRWLKNQTSPQNVLVVISGGNIDQPTHHRLWQDNYLDKLPTLDE